jgi:hypothetical protein
MIGAGGAGNYGGGGGAGACIVAINQTLPAGTCSVVVGDAPIGTNYYAKGGDSSISVAGTTRYLAKGGGPGGDVNKKGNDGGCGGGAGVINGTANIYTGGNTELTNIVNGTTVGPGITSTYAVLGNPGGDQRDPDGVRPSGGYAFGAGGGGIGDVGQTTSDNSTTNGNGGAGLNAVTINGISYNFKSYFANNADFGYNGYIGGGGGGSDGSGTKVGINGLTGDANYNHRPPENTGSGGNGSWGYGSSGIVIIRTR